MKRSVQTIYHITVGPSSSHTLGPIRAAKAFLCAAEKQVSVADIATLTIELQGSLALTGKGHLSDRAVVAGLTGYDPERDVEDTLEERYKLTSHLGYIESSFGKIPFSPLRDLHFNAEASNLKHPNTLVFTLMNKNREQLYRAEYQSVGGGKILGPGVDSQQKTEAAEPIWNMESILAECSKENLSLWDYVLMMEQRTTGSSEATLRNFLRKIWRVMDASIDHGLTHQGVLPGGLELRRRAKSMFDEYLRSLRQWRLLSREITLASIYGIAVSEENSSGGRVVTAPTCGSAGIVPAVLKMLQERYHIHEKQMEEALAIAGLVGLIVSYNASISGAEVGCQGEVGVAAAMAAAAACYLLGGTNRQIETAAEIGLEHHLGLACDPVCGLVQIPCIERNGVGAVNALNAANMALLNTLEQKIHFDAAVEAMKQIGLDMNVKYKETSQGGLAVLLNYGR